jgi:hypothetical protein
MPDQDRIGEEIHELLRQPTPPLVQEFARIHLYQYREEALEAARSDVDREQREERVAELRVRLRDRLRSLFAWAKETGRM